MADPVFLLSKLGWALARPSSLLLVLLLAGVLLSWRWKRLGRRVVGLAALGLLVVAVLPLDGWLARPLENRFPAPRQLPERVDGIVVLGGAINAPLAEDRGQPALNDHAERLTAFLALARSHPEARLVFTGGTGSLLPGLLTEADVARGLLAEMGLSPERVHFEGDSRNTWENAVYSRDLVGPEPGETWLLVTSAMHMPRAVGVFRKAGWSVLPWPVDYRTGSGGLWIPRLNLAQGLEGADHAAHEWAGLLAYRLMGRMDELFPGP